MVCFAEAGDCHTRATFRALVDAVMPSIFTCRGGLTVYFVPGAESLCIHEYVIWDLDHSHTPQSPNELPLSKSTANLLDTGAVELIRTVQASLPLNDRISPCGGPFAGLSRYDRLRAVTLLDNLQLNLQLLPPPYQNNPGLIRVMMNSINQLTLFGYYSEWFGYGSTRLCTSDFRRFECYPPSWQLTGYPGPAFGYRDLRGFVLKISRRKEV